MAGDALTPMSGAALVSSWSWSSASGAADEQAISTPPMNAMSNHRGNFFMASIL